MAPPTSRKPLGFPADLGSVTGDRTPRSDVLRPQRPLRDAAAAHRPRQGPTGVGLDSMAFRRRMVERLREEGVSSELVLAAMGTVPRHQFVDTALAPQAYEDTSLPIGLGQTISKPTVVGRMLNLLVQRPGARQPQPRPLGKVLEIGTGCGYQAALLALLARGVWSVERLRPLHEKARSHLDAIGAQDVRLVWGDGRVGHAPNAPYDTIVSAAGAEELPNAWLEQLAEGGRLVAPLYSTEHGGQVLRVIDRTAGGWQHTVCDAVHFVPLKSGTA